MLIFLNKQKHKHGKEDGRQKNNNKYILPTRKKKIFVIIINYTIKYKYIYMNGSHLKVWNWTYSRAENSMEVRAESHIVNNKT